MAPKPSKHVNSAAIQPDIAATRKRKVSSKITDNNFVGAESNAVTKRLKQSAGTTAAAAAAVKHQNRQPSVQDDVDSDSDIVPLNNPPRTPNADLDAADGTDDVEMADNDPDLDEDTPEVAKPIETAKEQLSETNY